MDNKSEAYPSMLSEVIEKLQKVLDLEGDMPIAAHNIDRFTCAKVTVYTLPRYWDGGVLFPLVPKEYPFHCSDWARGKNYHEYPKNCIIGADGPDDYEGDSIDGVPLPTPLDEE